VISQRGLVNLEPSLVSGIFADIDNWHRWMPGLLSTRILERGENSARLVMEQRFHGHKLDQELTCRFSAMEVHQLQLQGDLKHWECRWSFAPPPDGRGTTISAELQVELGGIMGLFVTDRFLGDFLDQSFRDTLQRLEQWGRKQGPAVAADMHPGKDVVLQVFETGQGLEMWLDGKTYRLK